MPPLLLYLAAYHLGDPSFMQGLARMFKQRPAGSPPVWLIHGSGEAGERVLEAQGLFPERSGGVLLAETPGERMLIERSLRTTNREIVALLTDQLTPALGVLGANRGLLRTESPTGRVTLGATDWLATLSDRGAVPVIGLLAKVGGTLREVAPFPTLLALAERHDAEVVCFLTTGRAGIRAEGDAPGIRARIPTADLGGIARLPEPEIARTLAENGLRVRLTTPLGALSQSEAKGTLVTGSAGFGPSRS